jgi:hypothetical protein
LADCTGGGGSPFEWTFYFGINCDSTHVIQETDPTTGKTVLHLKWLGSSDCGPPPFCTRMNWNSASVNRGWNNGYGFTIPTGSYTEIRMREAPVDTQTGSDPSPDYFYWVVCEGVAGGSDCPAGATGYEQDVLEMYGGRPVEIDYYHLSAALGKAKCAGATDAATTAGDECNFTREFHRMSPEGAPG